MFTAQKLFFFLQQRIDKIAFGQEIDLSVIRRDLNHLNKISSEAILLTLIQTASQCRPEKVMHFG